MNNTQTFKILKVKRINNSVYGNPAYSLIVEDMNGDVIIGKTASNAALGYLITWEWEKETKKLSYHYTKKGNLIFDKLIKEKELSIGWGYDE